MPRQGKSDHLNIVQDISSKLGLPVITPHNMHFCDHQGGSKYCGFNTSVGERINEPIPENDPPTPHQRPLARMLGRIQAHVPRENIYTSLSSDYRSFQHQDSFDKIESAGDDTAVPCALLLEHLLSSHSETSHHAHRTGCPDCLDYARSLDSALPKLFPQGVPGHVYGHVHYVRPYKMLNHYLTVSISGYGSCLRKSANVWSP